MVWRTFTSASHPLQPPALTWRSLRERPKRRRARSSSAQESARLPVQYEVVPAARRETVFLAEVDGARRAGVDAVGNRTGNAEIEPHAVGAGGHRAGGARVTAGRTVGRALRVVDDRQTANRSEAWAGAAGNGMFGALGGGGTAESSARAHLTPSTATDDAPLRGSIRRESLMSSEVVSAGRTD